MLAQECWLKGNLAARQASPPPRFLPNPCDAARGPEASVPRGGRAERIERAGKQRGLFQAATLQAPDQASRLGGATTIEGSAGVEARRWMGPTVSPHHKVELVGLPAPPGRTQALTVQGRGQARISGHATPAQFVQQ